MARLYADEAFDFRVVIELRRLGLDVLTAQEAGQGNRGVADAEVLAFAIGQGRALLTSNRRHFIDLHRKDGRHLGTLACTRDRDALALASRIDRQVRACPDIAGQLLRVNRAPSP